jgi:ketosteroid isomerase-like protein
VRGAAAHVFGRSCAKVAAAFAETHIFLAGGLMNRIGMVLGAAAAGIVAMGIASHAESKTSDRQQIIDLENGLASAKTVDQAMSYYDDSEKLVVFDVIPPLQYAGPAAWRKDLKGFFAAFPGPSHIDLTNLQVVNDSRIGFAHSIQHFAGTAKSGKKVEITFRVTDGLEKKSGKWKIVHEHVSVPVDLDSGRAYLNAKQ